MKKICGIYKITNKINGKCYIGQSNDIHRRWKQELAPNAKLNPHLARAFEKYGIDNFEFEIIEECQREQLNEREQFYIEIYHSIDPKLGYNKTEGGDGNLGRHFIMSEEQKEKIRKANSGRKYTDDKLVNIRYACQHKIDPNQIVIYCYETNKYYLSIGKAAKELNICKNSIRYVISGKTKRTNNYRFCKITDSINDFISKCEQEDIILKEKQEYEYKRSLLSKSEKLRIANLGKHYSDEVNKKKGRPGRKHTEETKQKMSISKKNAEYIIKSRKPVKCIETGQIWESIEDAEKETGLQVSRCCRGLYLNTGNLHFEFVNAIDNEEFLEAKMKLKQNWLKTHKPVYCINNNKIYKTNVTAEKELGTEHHKITNSCNKNKPCKDGYQYRWLTQEEINKWIKNCLI